MRFLKINFLDLLCRSHTPVSTNQIVRIVMKDTLPWPWTPEDNKRTLSRKHSISQKDDGEERRLGDMS